MFFAYKPAETAELCSDLIDIDSGNMIVARDVEDSYQMLLAAAPELLQAVQRLLPVVERITLDSPHISDGHTAAKYARYAIVKATGIIP